MGNLSVDTSKLREAGQDIISLSIEFNEEINALFSRLANINTKTLEWVGASAQEYIRRTNIEKIQYINIKNSIYKYGKALCDVADEYDSRINSLR